MPYVGTSLATNYASTVRDSFTGDGSNTNFTLSRNAHHENDLEVFVGNVRQQPGSAYTVSGTTLAFTGTPANGEVIYVVHQAGALQTIKAGSDHGARDFNITGDANKITFGIDKEITVTHVADSGLAFKNTNTTDDKPFTLVLQTGETDIAASDKLGVINFQAPDEGTGTDAILVAAGIEAVSEGDFSSSSNATKLSFKTASSAAATEKMSLSSGGNLTVTGDVAIGGNLDVTGTVSFSEQNVTDVGILSLDTIAGDADSNTSIAFSGSDVITIQTGGTTAMTIDASQNTTLGGTLTAVTSIGIGSAVLTEAEMEMLDGITAGTAAANKAVVLDGSKNIATIGTIGSGNTTSSGTIQGTTITATTAFVPDASDGAALGTTSLEFSDLFLADGAVINLGADQDVTLTHVADTGILLNGSRQLQFGDSGTYIHQSADGVLDLVSDTELELNATTIDINGNVEVSGSLTGAGTVQGTTITATTAFVPDAADGAALGTTSLEFSDLFLADGAVISLGNDQDVTLTHVADTGILLNGTSQLQFNDASQNITAPSATVLDINATDEIELNATLVDVNANLDVSGTIQGTTITATTAFVPDASGGADLGSTSLEFGDVFIADDKAIKLGSDQDATIEYDEDGTDRLIIGGANVTFGKSVLGSVETANKTGDSVALDFATYQNFLLTFTGNVTLINPTTETVGQSGFIVIKQDGTGSRTLSIGTQYVTVGDAAYTLSTAANAIDLIPYVVQADGVILLGNPSLAFA